MKSVIRRIASGFLVAGSIAAATSLPAAGADVPAEPVAQGEGERAILTDVVQLTFGDTFEKAGEGYFSQQMDWVIFQGTPKGEKNYQMFVAPLLSESGVPRRLGAPVRITPADSRNTCGFFSPDGKSIIFGSTAGKEDPNELSSGFQRQGGTYQWDFPKGMEIYRVNDWKAPVEKAQAAFHASSRPPAGPTTSARELYASINLALPANRLTDNDAYDAEDAFSPDGKHICFTSLRTGDGEIWVMNADGSRPVQITHAKGYDGGPFFSPDGKRLVYRSDRKGNDLLQLFVADLAFDDKGEITGIAAEHQLTDDVNVNWGPYWHPDGQHLIFATSRQGHQNYELYSIRTDGSHATRITYTEGFDGLPVFSPDGKYLMWSAKRSKDKTVQLHLAKFNVPADW